MSSASAVDGSPARAAGGSSARAAAGEPVLREVADGVFAYVQPDGGWCVNNAGLVVSGGVSALVDTTATEARTRRLREQVLARGHGAPAMLVNTHSHGDHTFGNYLFPEATVYAHTEARREMEQAGLHMTQLWPEVVWGDIEVALPQVTYQDRMTLHVGGLAVELLHPGPAHTVNDTVVWVPERRTLFTGDVVMSGVTPFCPLGSVSGSLKAIERLRGLEPLVVVTGHGPVAGPEVLDVAEDYLRWVQELARQGLAAGLAPKDAAREADLGAFAELLEPARLIPNLHRAYAEERDAAHGEALDVGAMIREMGAVFQEMVAYNGGPLACHA
ncbi:MBL fold metallo-hydrolase [Streptomyces solincola]|uniref:MBL fold metallo-hydrolase n=1 Tax=Streptomyces solincola TaxID=2100817 RepID=A0A2S9Q1H8_9ACTN|nr:MBL fold metallo-hydrolase [Streptomyces solincola]PRH80508.1 MBL fold metallo-hydrolase [Streptomyces solincola]